MPVRFARPARQDFCSKCRFYHFVNNPCIDFPPPSKVIATNFHLGYCFCCLQHKEITKVDLSTSTYSACRECLKKQNLYD